MTRKMAIALLLACAAASAAHAGCPGDKSITYKDPVPVAPLDPLPPGSRIGVKDLRVEGFEFTRQHDPDFVAKYLSQILSNYGSYYRVVERQQLGDIQEELKLVESGTVQAGRDGKAPMSSAKSADYIVTGSITNPQVGSARVTTLAYNTVTHKLKYSKSFLDNLANKGKKKLPFGIPTPNDVKGVIDYATDGRDLWESVPGQIITASAFVDIKVIDAQNAEVVRQYTQTVSKQVCTAQTRDGMITDVDVINLQNASSGEVVRIINSFFQQQAAAEGGGAAVRVIADERSNSLLVGGDQAQRLKVKALIAHLDTPLDSGGDTQVRYLRYADSEKLAPRL